MNKFWSILGIGIILLSACHSGKTLKDDEINPALRKQLRQYGEQVIDGCAENRPDKVLDLSCDVFRERFEEGLKINIAQKGECLINKANTGY